MSLKIEFSWLILIIIVVSAFPSNAQLLENSSFEGPAGMATVPPGWQACGEASTPDTHPGAGWGVDSSPSNGKTYLGMVCRGEGGVLLPNCEAIQQKLKKTIIAGRCYFLKMDLAYSSTMINNYGKPIKLIVYGGISSCGYEEKLWESPKIDHTTWKNYSVNINASENFDYLILKADYASSLKYFGNINIDNLELTEPTSVGIKLDTLVKVNAEVKLKASPGSNYQWSPTLWLSCKDCSSPTSIPKDSITYKVSFIDQNGCKRDEIFKIKVTQEAPEIPENPDPTTPDEPEEFFIPNVFTPNNDGKNDVFEIVGLTPKSRIIIVNRWGKVVFESDDYKNDWSGDNLASGSYYYLLSYSKNGLKYNGWVEIVK